MVCFTLQSLLYHQGLGGHPILDVLRENILEKVLLLLFQSYLVLSQFQNLFFFLKLMKNVFNQIHIGCKNVHSAHQFLPPLTNIWQLTVSYPRDIMQLKKMVLYSSLETFFGKISKVNFPQDQPILWLRVFHIRPKKTSKLISLQNIVCIYF